MKIWIRVRCLLLLTHVVCGYRQSRNSNPVWLLLCAQHWRTPCVSNKGDAVLLSVSSPNIYWFSNSYTVTLSRKFNDQQKFPLPSNVPLHCFVKYLCSKFALITRNRTYACCLSVRYSVVAYRAPQFCDSNVSQSMYLTWRAWVLRCGGISSLTANFLENLPVKEFVKSVSICWRYRQFWCLLFCCRGVYVCGLVWSWLSLLITCCRVYQVFTTESDSISERTAHMQMNLDIWTPSWCPLCSFTIIGDIVFISPDS